MLYNKNQLADGNEGVEVTQTVGYQLKSSSKDDSLEKIKNKSMFKSEIDLCEDDKIITLSTCSYEFDDARLVIHGKLLK
ncbi:Hypothetical protein CM240_1790 [Clostridium bornimense]|uniref:Sortase B n=1 Tax=Clostridium bornimense TaxID=1216932 RepID=W6RX51_9CLOT|nr:hypothetical protein [Clostridium bornimense]CDM68948.1 Hypothetical protein CM240_1790 [Clostridium bornimense]